MQSNTDALVEHTGKGEARVIRPESRADQSQDRTTLAEGRLEICAFMPEGRKEVFERDKRKVELVGGQVSGGRVVITNLWTRVMTVLPADAVVKIYP